MKNKLIFLTKMSLNKKIKTKWFYIANIIFLILIAGLINIDSIIKFFGGDFEDNLKIQVIDNINAYDEFKDDFSKMTAGLDDYINTEVIKYDKTIDEFKEEHKKEEILIVLDSHEENLINAKIISDEKIGSITKTIINASLNEIYTKLALKKYNVSEETFATLNKQIIPEEILLTNDDTGDDVLITSVMQIFTMPLFMLIIFLVQMIGAEVNEEKTTKSMEIIISNVSPKTHFMAKVLSSNLFVIIQGALLIIYGIIGVLIRMITNPIKGNIIEKINIEIPGLTNIGENISGILYIIPILLIMTLLTFFAYSLLAGILASMTTNQEDFQQLQTPIVVISLIGYYLSMMTSVFKGSIFIRIMSYIPFISSILSPTLLVLGDITIIDLVISISLLIGTIYLLIHYGLRIYKVGILNYSGTNLWKKMFSALRR